LTSAPWKSNFLSPIFELNLTNWQLGCPRTSSQAQAASLTQNYATSLMLYSAVTLEYWTLSFLSSWGSNPWHVTNLMDLIKIAVMFFGVNYRKNHYRHQQVSRQILDNSIKKHPRAHHNPFRDRECSSMVRKKLT
jgi:hypothetical protein